MGSTLGNNATVAARIRAARGVQTGSRAGGDEMDYIIRHCLRLGFGGGGGRANFLPLTRTHLISRSLTYGSRYPTVLRLYPF